MKRLLTIIFMLGPAIAIAAGPSPNSGIEIAGQRLQRTGDELTVDFDIRATGLSIRCNGLLTVEPAIENSVRRFVLPSVVYSGAVRARYEERRRLLSDSYSIEPYRTYTRIKKKKSYRMNYHIAIPFQAWMEQASLKYRIYTHDCSGNRLTEQEVLVDYTGTVPVPELVAPVIPVQPIPVIPLPAPQPVVPVVPEPEPIPAPISVPCPEPRPEDIRSVVLELPIVFPVNQTEVLPGYGNNRRELARIDSLFDALSGGGKSGIHIEQISIRGYASPEGEYVHNEWLAHDRSESFKYYLLQQGYPFGEALSNAAVSWVAEDWEGLAVLVEQSDMLYKNEALYIIRDVNLSFDGRDEALAMIEPWSLIYRVLLDDMYPRLRRIELRIDYTETE